MKIESFDHALPLFKQRIHGLAPGNLLEAERSKAVLANLLRWEDDGGKIVEINRSTLEQKRKKTNA